MTWLRLDDEFAENPKIAGLSDRAFRFHVAALCVCAGKLTDGAMTAKAVRVLAVTLEVDPKRRVQELQSAGLWNPTDDGWVINDYLDYNPAAADVKRERARNAKRQRDHKAKVREVRDAVADSLSNAAGNALPNAVSNGGANAAPSRPVTKTLGLPIHVSEEPKVSTGHGTRVPEHIQPLIDACHAHGDDIQKLERATRGKSQAVIVAALESCRGPGVRDRLAVALSELGNAKRR